MQSNKHNNLKISTDFFEVNGFNVFKKKLEKDFFADANIQISPNDNDSKFYMNITLNCNINLSESLFHLKSNNWGGFYKYGRQVEFTGFVFAVNKLQEQNTQKISIEELTINFKDTSLFIIKIPNEEITNQLCSILEALAENFVHFTKGYAEMPYEIFVPVFEDPTDSILDNTPWVMEKIKASYLDYWGLYFYSEINQDSLVYCLKEKSIIDGDFFLLNKK